ncbi:MAG: hypothetical protein K5663_03245 [Clostridiales bacterium]|nr:hypothetical protein [Clostridiales bacterium]
MKRYIVLLLACAVMLALPTSAEEAENPAAGVWYADAGGAAVTLTLSPDGTYTLDFPALPEFCKAGTWELRDGFVYLDGDERTPLSFSDTALTRTDAGLRFIREPVETYAAADPLPEATADLFDGLWISAYTLPNGFVLPSDPDDDTLVYIEKTKAILKGGPFGYILTDLAFENGAMTYSADGLSVRIELQQDGLMRLTVQKDGLSETRILTRSAFDDPVTED